MSGWVRPSLCGGNGECIEVRAVDEPGGQRIWLRHSGGLNTLAFFPAEFAAFIAAAKNGEYDHLTAAP